MIVLNFSHPLSEEQVAQITALVQAPLERVVQIATQFDEQRPFAAQAAELVGQVELAPEAWQTTPLLVVLPSLNNIAALMLAEMHGRMGYFPAIVRMRPVADSLLRRFEVAEILDLQRVRDAARFSRKG